jgi:hypothetical protein
VLAASTLCFVLPGDGFSPRFEDAVHHGWVGWADGCVGRRQWFGSGGGSGVCGGLGHFPPPFCTANHHTRLPLLPAPLQLYPRHHPG